INYQVQRPAAGRSARGRASARVLHDGSAARGRAPYVSPFAATPSWATQAPRLLWQPLNERRVFRLYVSIWRPDSSGDMATGDPQAKARCSWGLARVLDTFQEAFRPERNAVRCAPEHVQIDEGLAWSRDWLQSQWQAVPPVAWHRWRAVRQGLALPAPPSKGASSVCR